jgi:hypothetical protein
MAKEQQFDGSDFSVLANRNPSSGMVSDIDVLEIKDGAFYDKVNVQLDGDGTWLADVGTLGNTIRWTIPPQELQNQKVRIYLDSFFTSGEVRLYNNHNQLISAQKLECGPSLQENKTALINGISLFPRGVSFEQEPPSTLPYLDVEINFYYSDYTLVVINELNENVRTAILQEAICATGAGEWIENGNRERNGVLFRTHTTQEKLRETGEFIQSAQVYGGRIVLQIEGHGLSQFESFVVSNMVGNGVQLNGVWVADVIDQDYVALYNSIPGTISITPFFYEGYIFKNPYGLGMFTAQEYLPNTDSYKLTVIAKSKKLNLVSQRQVDLDLDFFDGQYSAYFTDFYNPHRCIYFIGKITEQMVFTAINPDGVYAFDTFYDEILCEVNSRKFTIENLPQDQSGGNTPPGTWRYTAYLKTEGNAATEVAPLTEKIPVYAPEYKPTGYQVYGSVGALTSKINRVQVTGLTPGVYKYIVLVGVLYSGADNNAVATSAFEIREEQLGPDQTSIVLEHNGNELDTRAFDIRKLNVTREDALLVGCNVLGQNRLFRGNIVTTRSIDIRAWVAKFKYSIKRFNLYGSYGAETVEEFYKPESSVYTGYQQYEWYRFYVAAKSLITGTITDATFCFDVRFLSQADYDANEFISTNITDRRDMNGDDFVDYDLGDDQQNFFQYYLRLKGVDWDFQIEGVPARELFSDVYICRCERVKEVLADGEIVLTSATIFYNSNLEQESSYFETRAFVNLVTEGRNFFPFYSPDILFGINSITETVGDKLLSFGAQKRSQILQYPSAGPLDNSWVINWGITSVTSPVEVDVTNVGYVDTALDGIIGGNRLTKRVLQTPGSGISGEPGTFSGVNPGSPVIKTAEPIFNNSPYQDFGVYRVLYFRRKKDKYGSIFSSGSNVVFTGAVIPSGEQEGNVFGGDVYSQQTWFKRQYISTENPNGNAIGENIISQNGINTNLRIFDPESTTSWLFPQKSPNAALWLGFTIEQVPDQIIKNSAYQAITQSQFLYVYNPSDVARNLKPSQIQYSDLMPNGSQTDFRRTWPPLNFRDNPLTFGSIQRLDFFNGELFTLQERNITREFVSNTGRLGTLEDGSVIIGDGSVLDRKGINLSVMGSRHPWSYVRALNDSGTDVRYWINDELDSFMRKGPDGIVNLSERKNMSLFFRKRLRFIKGKTNPAGGQGVHCVWDNIGKNVIITARGWKDSENWAVDNQYSAGTTVLLGEEYGIPIMYLCLFFNQSTSENMPGTPEGNAFWERVSIENTDYYSVFTLVFNEKANAFWQRHTFYPKIYATHNNRYFSPNPETGSQGDVYRYRDGETLVFFGLEHEGYMQTILNYKPSLLKKFIALAYTSLRNPIKVKVESQFISEAGIDNRVTEMNRDTPGDMKYRENQSYVIIKNSFNSQGQTNRRTPQIKGLYAIITTYFKAREFQKINDIHVGIRLAQRNNENP